MPLFTVAIPTLNRARYLAETLHCLKAQTCQDFDIVISDNASTDDTPGVIRSFSDRRTLSVRQATLIDCGSNWMACAELARTEWIIFNQDDDLLCPTFLERCAHAIRQHPDIVMFAADIVHTADVERLAGGTICGFPFRHRWGAAQPRVFEGAQLAALNWFMTGFMPPAQAFRTALFRKHCHTGADSHLVGGDVQLTSHVACEGTVAYESFIGAIIRHHPNRLCVLNQDALRLAATYTRDMLVKLFADRKIDWQQALRTILPELAQDYREMLFNRYCNDDLIPRAAIDILAASIAHDRGLSVADLTQQLATARRANATGGRLDRIGLPRPMVRMIRGVLASMGKKY